MFPNSIIQIRVFERSVSDNNLAVLFFSSRDEGSREWMCVYVTKHSRHSIAIGAQSDIKFPIKSSSRKQKAQQLIYEEINGHIYLSQYNIPQCQNIILHAVLMQSL